MNLVTAVYSIYGGDNKIKQLRIKNATANSMLSVGL